MAPRAGLFDGPCEPVLPRQIQRQDDQHARCHRGEKPTTISPHSHPSQRSLLVATRTATVPTAEVFHHSATCCEDRRWFPDKPSFEALDDKMQAGYELRESGAVAVCRVWLEAWSDVLHILDKAGMQSIQEFDERFGGSQSHGPDAPRRDRPGALQF
jgi:hypothetical protein